MKWGIYVNSIAAALTATGFTFFMTSLGAACVFLFVGPIKDSFQRAFLGFAAGVMMAASCWSMIVPAIDMAHQQGKSGWLQAGGGFILGAACLLVMDKFITKQYIKQQQSKDENSGKRRTALLFGSITLHNIPEGMAVGLACALAVQSNSPAEIAAAVALALGIGLQNFPEGAAVSLPFRQEGYSKMRSFLYGAASGAVEPLGGVIAVVLAVSVANLLPWLLSFAAGAMIYAVACELIPRANKNYNEHAGVIGVIAGFAFMMILDVSLS